MRITAVTPMKNEGPYIVEWLAHHMARGINDILVFSNDCHDGTDLMLERLDEMGLLRHAPNPSILLDNPRHHIQLINYINEMPRLRRSDWVINLDADEFLSVNTGKGHVEDLLNAVPDVDAISLSLVGFGCNGEYDISEDQLQTEIFVRANAREDQPAAIKSFMRTDRGCHRFANNSPIYHRGRREKVTWVNGDGTVLDVGKEFQAVKFLPAEQSGYGLAHINHYAVRSMQGFMVKWDRGNANPLNGVAETDLQWNNARRYWKKHDRNEVEDRSLADHAADLRDRVQELLKDAELRELHEKSIAWHRKRARQLRKDPGYSDLLKTMRRIHRRATLQREEDAPLAMAS